MQQYTIQSNYGVQIYLIKINSNNNKMPSSDEPNTSRIQQKYRYVPIFIVIFVVFVSFGGPLLSRQFCIGYQLSLLILLGIYTVIIIRSLRNYKLETQKIIEKYHKREKEIKLKQLKDIPHINQQQEEIEQFLQEKNPLNFAIIINVFDYDEFQLTHIIDSLSRHPKARNQYLIFVVIDSNILKTNQIRAIRQKMSKKFKTLYFCPMIANFRKGNKANMPLKLFQSKLNEENVDLNQLMVISLQGNCWCPIAFILEIQTYLKQNFSQLNSSIFFAPSANSVNRQEAPYVNRVYEVFNNIMKNTMCYNPTFFKFNTSNFCVSFNQLKQIGFFNITKTKKQIPHLALQLFWNNPKTTKFISIATPFNGYSYSTKTGVLNPIKKQFEEAFEESQRYCQFAYSCKYFLKAKKKSMNKNLTVFLQQYALFFIGISIPLFFLSAFFQILVTYIFDLNITVFPLKVYGILFSVVTILLALMSALLQQTTNRAVIYFHGVASKKSILMICFQLIVFLPISGLLFMVPGLLREIYGIYRYNRRSGQQQVQIEYNAADILNQNY